MSTSFSRACAAAVPFVLLVWTPNSLLLAADTSIPAAAVPLFVGEKKIVEDTVVAGERDGNTVRLRLGRQPPQLTVALVVGILSNFPPEPERYYVGRTVRVAGTIRSFRGAPEIIVRDVADLQVVAAASDAAARAPAASRQVQDASTEQRLEALDERVHLLEQRVRQLEHPRASNAAR